VLRSCNNLLEKWHQSFFLYFLSAPHGYISVGVYMIPFILLLVSLPLTAVALCSPAKEEETKFKRSTKQVKEDSSVVKENESEARSDGYGFGSLNPERTSVGLNGLWLQALALVGSVQVWAIFVALNLYLISQTSSSAGWKLSIWLAVAVTSLKVALSTTDIFSVSARNLASPLRQGETQFWMAVKALTLGATSIGLGVMSIYNYPVALIGALILVPICLAAHPLQRSWDCANKSSKRILFAFLTFAVGLVMIIIGSPPGLARLLWSLSGNSLTSSPANFWYFMESLLHWRSALFFYSLVIHLPTSVLCIYVFSAIHRPNSIKR
jgi:glycosylphosphatidylinositol transamidase